MECCNPCSECYLIKVYICTKAICKQREIYNYVYREKHVSTKCSLDQKFNDIHYCYSTITNCICSLQLFITYYLH